MSEQERSNPKGKVVDLDGADPKKKTTTGQVPRSTTGAGGQPAAHAPAPPPVGATSGPIAAPGLVGSTSAVKQQTQYQKKQLASAFANAAEEQSKKRFDYSLGNAKPLVEEGDDEETTSIGAEDDGVTPAKELTSRDLWKVVQAPVQSREGRRSPEVFQMVINQFAVEHNPRYEPDTPTKPRSHIFVWDVSRAMNCEIPHFMGAKELSLGQTVDWLRHEGPMRGWNRCDVDSAHEYAMEGKMVVVIPKDVTSKLMAVVLPLDELSNNKPFVAAAAQGRGNKLGMGPALGTFLVEFFFHQ